MDSRVTKRLIELNRDFYEQFAGPFSATRQRLQPGVKKILDSVNKDDSVLDLGCGNGLFLRELHDRGHRAPLLGADFSPALLREAGATPGIRYIEIDLTRPSVISDQLSATDHWSLITMFATLHHIPSAEIRVEILQTVKKLLKPDGRFILSNWQFLNSEKLKSRIQPWSRAGLSDEDVDAGDYLLDWRAGGGGGLRYVHQFSVEELLELANQVQMKVEAGFYSDGENGRLGLYQIWIHQ